MNIRAANGADLDDIMTLERASFPTDAWSEAMMREELASPHGHYIVAEEAGRVVGYAGLRAPRGAKDGDVQTIALAEAFRGHGRGRMLLTTLLAQAAESGVRDVFLEVRADNPVARALYVSEGFAEVGRRPRYYQPDDVDAVVMSVSLPGWTRGRTPDPGAVATSTPSAGLPASVDAASESAAGSGANRPKDAGSSDEGAPAKPTLQPLAGEGPSCDLTTGWCS